MSANKKTDFGKHPSREMAGEAHFRNLVDNALVGIVDTTLDGSVIYANRAVLRILDYDSQDEFLASGSLLLWRDPKRRKIFIAELQKHGFVNNFDAEIVTRKGRNIYLLVTSTIKSDVISNMVTDITERKAAEDALRESRAKLAKAEQIAGMGFLVWELATNSVTLSESVHAIFGVAAEVVLSVDQMTTLLHPDDRNRVVSALVACSKGTGNFDMDHRMIRPDGTIIWVHGRADLQFDANGTPESVIGTVVNISDRKAVEEKLLLRSKIVANMSEAVHVARAKDGMIIFTNPAFDKAFGYEPDELLGTNFSLLYAPADEGSAGIIENVTSILNRTGIWQGETLNVRKDGSYFWCEANISSFDHPEHGTVWLSVRSDITSRRRMEQEQSSLVADASSRLRKLNCLYDISNLIRTRTTIDEILEDAVAVIPTAWRYPDIACCRLRYMEQEWVSESFEDSPWLQSSEITISGERCGNVEVFYAEERPTLDEGPFAAEERLLLDGIARILSEAIGRNLADELRADSETRFRMIYEHAPVMINAFDADGRCVMWNNECERVYGRTADEVFAQEDPMALFYPDPHVRQQMRDSIATEPDGKFVEWSGFAKDGSQRHALWTSFLRQKGQIFNLGYDITERKKAEQLLLENKKDLIDSQALAQIGNWSWDVEKNVITWSDELYRIYGISPGTHLTYERLIEAIHPDDRAYHDAVTEKWLKNGATEPYNYRVIRSDGRVRFIKAVGEIEYSETGQPVRMFGLLQDVTEQKDANNRIREREATLQALLNAPLEVIMLLSRNGDVLSINERGASGFGEKPEDMIGRNIYENMDDEVARVRKEHAESVFTSGQPLNFHDRVGDTHFAHSTYPVFDNDGKNVISIASFSADITERIQAEQEIEEYQQRLKSMTSQLVLADEQARRQIATDLHDHIGQSLTLMRLQLAAAQKHMPDGSKQDLLLTEVSQSLLNAIRETRNLIFELSSPSLNELGLGPAIAEWVEQHVDQDLGIRVNLVDQAQDAQLSQDLRAMVFRNVRELLTNVIKHADAGFVSISLHESNDQLTITIKDDGKGFDPDSNSRAVTADGGFGLFSIRERMTDLGGSLVIDSRPGMGCTAVLNIPTQSENTAMQA